MSYNRRVSKDLAKMLARVTITTVIEDQLEVLLTDGALSEVLEKGREYGSAEISNLELVQESSK